MDILKGATMRKAIVTVLGALLCAITFMMLLYALFTGYEPLPRPPYQGWQNGQIQKANIKICRTNAGG